jgi:hypothetical protein
MTSRKPQLQETNERAATAAPLQPAPLQPAALQPAALQPAAPQPARKKRRYKSVSRVDQAKRKAHGYYVRVVFKGQIYSRFFSDSVWGGKRGALSEAIRCRDQIEKQLGKPRTNRTVVTESPKTRTGVPGIRRTLKHTGAKDPNSKSEVYEVTWSPQPNVLKRTSISIEKYGEEEAFRRALSIRERKEREMYGSTVAPGEKTIAAIERHSLQQ